MTYTWHPPYRLVVLSVPILWLHVHVCTYSPTHHHLATYVRSWRSLVTCILCSDSWCQWTQTSVTFQGGSLVTFGLLAVRYWKYSWATVDPTTKEKLVHTYIHVCTYSVVMEMFCETKATHRMKYAWPREWPYVLKIWAPSISTFFRIKWLWAYTTNSLATINVVWLARPSHMSA